MNELTKLAIEIIEELMKLSVQEINEVREEWLKECQRNRGDYQNIIRKFVNHTCDCAIRKVSGKTA